MARLAELSWRFIPERVARGPVQMALEEAAAETVRDGGPALARVFRWRPSTLSLGYHQAPSTVDWAACERRGVDVTRRQTGGGGIFHDHEGDLSYSIVVPADAVPGDLLESYHLLCEPILTFLRDLGLPADFADRERPPVHQPACFLRAIHPAHDILADGRKICGNAQYRQRDVVIQHGSINLAVDPSEHLGVFAGHDVAPGEFADRVTALDEHVAHGRATLVGRLERTLREWAGADEGAWSDAEHERARTIAAEKYADAEWIRRRPASPE